MNDNEKTGIRRYATVLEEKEEEHLAKVSQDYNKKFLNKRWGIWMDFAGTTTLHGPNHLTCTKKKTRSFYIIVVLLMNGMFVTHAGYLVLQYLSFPVLTEIKFGNIDFTYPDISICPNAPFTNSDVPEDSKLQSTLESTSKFWSNNSRIAFGSLKAHQKRSMLSHFYRMSDVLGKKPHQYVLDCEVNRQECLDNFIIAEHPIYYRCFLLRVRLNPPVPAGPTNGIRMILHRGRVSAIPMLLIVEEEPTMLQAIDSPEAFHAKDGFFIAFHEANTFPSFPVQSLPNGLSMRFGQSVRIGLEQVDLQSVDLVGRKCLAEGDAPQIELLRLDKQSESNAPAELADKNMLQFSYTRQACVANHRQRLIHMECKCFSESYAIPYSMRDIGQVWCHDLDTSTTNIIGIADTLECVEKIALMTDEQVVAKTKPETEGDGIPGCPLRCVRRMTNVHSSLQTKTVQHLQPKILIPYFEMLNLHKLDEPGDSFINMTGPPINPMDLIFLDIHPVGEMVNQIIENPGYTVIKFLSDFGGISGLYVGITVYTIAEILDVITQFLGLYVPYILSMTKLELTKNKNYLARMERRQLEGEINHLEAGGGEASNQNGTTQNNSE